MNKSFWLYTTLVIALNVLPVAGLRHWVVSDHSDKSIILWWVFYPLIILGNGIAWGFFRKKALGGILRLVIIALLSLFFPLLITL
jgi:hypothetical protein